MTPETNTPLVIVDIYSGVPDPSWHMTSKDAADFARQLSHLPPRTTDPRYLEPNAWYGGILVVLDAEANHVITVHDQHVFDSTSEVVRLDANRVLEQWLYALIPRDQLEVAASASFADLTAPQNEQPLDGVGGGVEPVCAGAPPAPVAPIPWNVKKVRLANNCYNYANNEVAKVSSALPGRKLRITYTEAEMDTLLQNDGLKPVGKTMIGVCNSAPGSHLIAVGLRKQDGTQGVGAAQVPKYRDFHCLRLDQGGVWSHKDGAKKVKDTDNTNQKLNDITKSFFKPKLHLVGFYWSIQGKRTIDHP